MISCYSPTNASDEIDIITFYNDLYSLAQHILKHNVLMVRGDINAQIGKDENNKFGLHNLPNRNSKYLTFFSFENSLSCLNTKLKKKKGKLWTYTYPSNTKVQIDYIFINKKWINSTVNCKAYSSFEGVSSNYRIVMAKICLGLHRTKKQTVKITL